MDQDRDDVGAESVLVQTAHRSAQLDTLGSDRSFAEGQHSKMDLTGEIHWLNTDFGHDCRLHGHLDTLPASASHTANKYGKFL